MRRPALLFECWPGRSAFGALRRDLGIVAQREFNDLYFGKEDMQHQPVRDQSGILHVDDAIQNQQGGESDRSPPEIQNIDIFFLSKQ